MMPVLIGSFLAVIYGGCTTFRSKTPLFYKIIFLGMLTCFMGNVYTVLYELLWEQGSNEFHVGYLGYIGMFFFLYSSYYGAIDSLADGKEPELRRFRIAAKVIAVGFFIFSTILIFLFDKGIWILLLLIPMSFTLYFAMKHLIIPDVEMGIIKVMRLYNSVIISLCIFMMLNIFLHDIKILGTILSICSGILLTVSLPIARNGVHKWFI